MHVQHPLRIARILLLLPCPAPIRPSACMCIAPSLVPRLSSFVQWPCKALRVATKRSCKDALRRRWTTLESLGMRLHCMCRGLDEYRQLLEHKGRSWNPHWLGIIYHQDAKYTGLTPAWANNSKNTTIPWLPATKVCKVPTRHILSSSWLTLCN